MKSDKEIKIPVRIVKINRISDRIPKWIKQGLSKPLLKKVGSFALLFAIISSQVFLLSAFEAHVINVTAHICSPSETRTMGYWKNHPNVYENCLFPSYLLYLGDYPVDLKIESEDQVNEVFDAANADIMRDMLKGQLLAMKFNICAFGIDDSEGEEFDGGTLGEIVNRADNLLRDPDSTREEQEIVKDLLDYANNLHQIKYCSTQPSWLNAALAKKTNKEPLPVGELTASLEAALFTGGEILVGEPPTEEPFIEEQPLAEEPLAEEPLLEEQLSAEEEPLVEEPPIEELPAEEPLIEEIPAEEEPPIEEPAIEEPPIEEEPPVDEPPVEELPAEEPPVEEEPPIEEPPVEDPPVEEPVPEPTPEPEPETS